jgi:glutamate racemase
MVDFAFVDSGTGGIPYLLHLKEKCPTAKCVYIGDTANFPYGEKSHEEIVNCVLDCTAKIISSFNPKVIILACNTMSVNALDVLRSVYPDQLFVGTVPAIKVAAERSRNHCIGLMATNSTVNHPYNQDLKNHFAADCTMVTRGDPELISFIEHKSFISSEEEIEEACKPSVEFFRKKGCDVIILGCTHFLNISEQLKKAAAPDILIVDSREGVVNRALSIRGEITPEKDITDTLYVTGFSDKKDQKEYELICKKNNLLFGGILQ